MKKKKSIKKNTGFTLIELLAVISVLAVTLSISFYSVTAIIKNAKLKTYKTTVNEVESAAKNYLVENGNELVFGDVNTEVESQCIWVQDLIDYGFLDNDVVKSKATEDKFVNGTDYIYIVRNKATKAIVKNVYVYDESSAVNSVCKNSIEQRAAINFNLKPNGWSRKKEVKITYKVKISGNYDYGYEFIPYNSSSSHGIAYSKDKTNPKTVYVYDTGSLFADIRTSSNEVIKEASLDINNIDSDGPKIELVSNEKKYASKNATIPLKVYDCDLEGESCSGLDHRMLTDEYLKNIINDGHVKVQIGDDTVKTSELELKKVNNNQYDLVISAGSGSKYNGKVVIKILADTFFDLVVDEDGANGNKETTLYPDVTFDSIPPTVGKDSTKDPFENSQEASLICDDNTGVYGYYIGNVIPNDNNYTEVSGGMQFPVKETITTAGTYYLGCKDVAGNTTVEEINYYNYTIKNMLLKLDGNVNSYTLTNYAENSSNVYLLPEGANISINDINNRINNTMPTGSCNDNYVGYSRSTDANNMGILVKKENINSNDFIIADNYIYRFWFNRNELRIKYKVRTDETLSSGTLESSLYAWSLDSNRYVKRTIKSNSNSTIILNAYRYNTSDTTIDLYDNSTSSYFAIKKTGNTPASGEEWVCTSGCKTSNMLISKSAHSVNINSDICDISNKNCEITVSANYRTNKVNVRYHLNGGMLVEPHGSSIGTTGSYITLSGSTIVSTFEYGSALTPHGLVSPSNSTYVNIGKTNYNIPNGKEWYKTNSDGSKTYFNEADNTSNSSILCDASNGDCTVTVYANWQASVYTITLDKNGGTGGTNNIYEKYNTGWYSNSAASSSITKITIPTRTGYRFEGYYDGDTEIINSDGTITASNTYFTENKTITARWTSYKVNIKYNMNGGTLSTTNSTLSSTSDGFVTKNGSTIYSTYNYGATLSESGLANYNNSGYINIVKTGYKGKEGYEWNTNANGTGTSYNQATGNINVNTLCDASNGDCTVTLYVNWIPNIYNITLDKNGGSGGTNNIYEKYNTGWYSNSTASSSITTVTVPTKANNQFEGYYDGNTQIIDSTGKIKVNNTYFTANKTITARWTIIDNTPPVINVVMKKVSGDTVFGSTYYKYSASISGVGTDSKWFKDQPKLEFTITDDVSGVDPADVKFYYNDSGSSTASFSDNLSGGNTLSHSGNVYTAVISSDGNRFVKVQACNRANKCSSMYVNFKWEKAVTLEFDVNATNEATALNTNPSAFGKPIFKKNSSGTYLDNVQPFSDTSSGHCKNGSGTNNGCAGVSGDNKYFGASCMYIGDYYRVFKIKGLSVSNGSANLSYSMDKGLLGGTSSTTGSFTHTREKMACQLPKNSSGNITDYDITGSNFNKSSCPAYVAFTGYKFVYTSPAGNVSNPIYVYTQYTGNCGYHY